MFEFSLENGKRQLVTGIKFLIITIIILLVWGIIIGICAGVGNDAAKITGLVFTILFVTGAGIIGLLSAIKIIFGAIVYHAERTSSRNNVDIQKDIEA